MSESDAVPNIVFGREYFSVDPQDAALLVIDMQNSFIAPDGSFRVPDGQGIVPNVDRLVHAARGHGIPVVWTQSDHSPPAGGLILARSPVVRERRELWKGERSFELYAAMTQPWPDECRVIKHKYDAFHDTDLERILRNLRRETVLITGVTTECCCESTARAAFSRDYKVVLVRDATASFTTEMHEQACERIDLHFGRTLTTDELIRIVEQGFEPGDVPALVAEGKGAPS